MCGVGERNALVGEADAIGIARRCQCERSFDTIGSVGFGATVVEDTDCLAKSEVERAVVAGSHENLILQCAAAVGIAFGGLDRLTAKNYGDETGVDDGVLLCRFTNVCLHRKEVVAFGQCNCFGQYDVNFGSCFDTCQTSLALPEADSAEVGFAVFEVQLEAVERKGIKITLGRDVDAEQVLVGSTDRGIGCRGLCGTDARGLHVARKIFADCSLESLIVIRIRTVGVEKDGE